MGKATSKTPTGTALPLVALAAVAPFMGRQDIRYYFNGACYRADGKLIATDGHVMLVVEGLPTIPADVIIPRDTVVAALRSKEDALTLCTGALSDGSQTWHFTPIAANFPNAEAAVTVAPTGEVAGFNPRLIARVAKAAEEVAKRAAIRKVGAMTFHCSGEKAARIAIAMHTDGLIAYGAVAPMRDAVPAGAIDATAKEIGAAA